MLFTSVSVKNSLLIASIIIREDNTNEKIKKSKLWSFKKFDFLTELYLVSGYVCDRIDDE